MSHLTLASQMQYSRSMKTATIPPVRIDPEFREAMEQSLQAGESLTSLVETAVRAEVDRRRAQSEFIRRGMASIEKTVARGDGIGADALIARLEGKLQAAKTKRNV